LNAQLRKVSQRESASSAYGAGVNRWEKHFSPFWKSRKSWYQVRSWSSFLSSPRPFFSKKSMVFSMISRDRGSENSQSYFLGFISIIGSSFQAKTHVFRPTPISIS
jgi:hypothetical protein